MIHACRQFDELHDSREKNPVKRIFSLFLPYFLSQGCPGRQAAKLRGSDCGMRIEKENPKNPKSAIRNPK
jgi:hypothetical protein